MGEKKQLVCENIKKWENTLASCIRCGYCFEHCPLVKYTGWESDAPRARLIMIYGLLSGDLAPSDYVAAKVFSCFYCKRCEAACSSGVPLTEIFTDAKKDLVAAGYEGPGTTSVTHKNCALCLACIEACPHDARTYSDNRIVTDPAMCQGCGICVEVCPAGAAKIENNFGCARRDLVPEIGKFMEKPTARAIVFACNWSYYPFLQSSVLPESETEDRPYKILVNMCGGRLDLPVLMAPFLHNAYGVMVACCPDDECEHDGNKKAKLLVKTQKKLLQDMGIDPDRVQLVQIPHGDKAEFEARIDMFMETIKQKGPIT